MALHALRNVIGEQAWKDTAHAWVAEKRYVTGTIEQFVELAEQRSGKQLDDFFDAWLFTPAKPRVGPATGVPESAAHAPKAASRAAGSNAATLAHSRG